MQKNTSTLSRRKVTAGIAWSVPAVAAVAAAPFAAASPTGCVSAVPGAAVKFPGGSGPDGIFQAYGFTITITNTSPTPVYVNPGTVTVEFEGHPTRGGEARLYTANPCRGGKRLAAMDPALLLQSGQSKTYYYVVNNTGNSAQESGCVKGKLQLALPTNAPEGADLCNDGIVEFSNCFETTPPSAKC
ncbi:hypothetical protein DE149_103190 [Micrococcus sp. KT16]|uniref:hypothetical protein n=1 Tax=Micrococcus sp. KT16 TaxID=2184005 RepID=UPI000DE879F7|nr:hypothetical protein [Micrococcus sp. KT16]RBO88700.1 hypothetical protein DE149_103190 [Micrococcus sp. KT16]